MKIELNSDMKKFFLNGSLNLVNSIQMDRLINVKEKGSLQKLIKLQQCKNSIDEIHLDENLILENPYYKNIKLKETSNGKFKLKNEVIPKYNAINISFLVPDEDRTMNDIFKMGYFNKNIKVPTLVQKIDKDIRVWMSPTLSEQNTINPFIDKNAKGNVLTFGLGIGYFVYMALLKEEVKSVTVVEYNQEVIDMFNEIILPQFKLEGKEVNIIKGNAFDYFNKDFLDKFDYIFVDIWESNDDGFEIIQKLLEQENYKGNIDYWIEFTCYKFVRGFMFLYFRSLANGTLQELLSNFKDEEKDLLTKIHRYFREDKNTIKDVNELKDYLYDIEIIREILSKRL